MKFDWLVKQKKHISERLELWVEKGLKNLKFVRDRPSVA
jgi:hypothetical protein